MKQFTSQSDRGSLATRQEYCPKCAAVLIEGHCSCGWSPDRARGKATAAIGSLVIAGAALWVGCNNFYNWVSG